MARIVTTATLELRHLFILTTSLFQSPLFHSFVSYPLLVPNIFVCLRSAFRLNAATVIHFELPVFLIKNYLTSNASFFVFYISSEQKKTHKSTPSRYCNSTGPIQTPWNKAVTHISFGCFTESSLPDCCNTQNTDTEMQLRNCL